MVMRIFDGGLLIGAPGAAFVPLYLSLLEIRILSSLWFEILEIDNIQVADDVSTRSVSILRLSG